MLIKIKRNLFQILALALLLTPAMAGTVGAQNNKSGDANIQGSLCQGADLEFSTSGGSKADCKTGGAGSATSKINEIIDTVINVFSVIVGIVAVIMIIYGGFRYITSGGDSNNVTAAKNTILYAIIGLIIVALAQFVVKFILEKTVA